MAASGVEIIGLKEVQRDLARLGARAPTVVGSALYEEAETVVRKAKQEAPVAWGDLRDSIQAERPKILAQGGVSVTIGAGGTAAPYALYVHEGIGPAVGRPPFFPRVDPIRRWLIKKGLDESLAFVVARAIGQRGLPPTKFLEKPFREQVRGMAGRIARRIRAEVRRAVR